MHFGLLHPHDTPVVHLTPTCTAATCHFPTTTSLAVCAAVEDVSSRLSVSSLGWAGRNGEFDGSSGSWIYRASLPNDVHLTGITGSYGLNMSSPSLPSDLESNSIQSPLSPNASFVSPASRTLAFRDKRSLSQAAIANFFLVFSNQTESPDSDELPSFRAVEVLLHFCVRTYSVSVENGVPISTVTSTTANTEDGSGSGAENDGIILKGPQDTTFVVGRSRLQRLQSYTRRVLSGEYAVIGKGMAQPTVASEAFGTALYGGSRADKVGRAVGGDASAKDIVAAVSENIGTSLTNV